MVFGMKSLKTLNDGTFQHIKINRFWHASFKKKFMYILLSEYNQFFFLFNDILDSIFYFM